MSRSEYPNTLPSEIIERIKNIENIYKIENIKLLPVSRSYPLISSQSPRIEIFFPNDSVLNLDSAILEAELTFYQLGNVGAAGPNSHTKSVYPPRYGLASLIEELNVYINGVAIAPSRRYNFIHNWIKDWVEKQDVEIISKGLNEVKDPSMIYQYPTTGSLTGKVVPRRGFPVSQIDAGAGANQDEYQRHKNLYHFNLGNSVGFFGEGSSKIINTSLIGEIKLEIIFTSAVATCISGTDAGANPVFPQNADTVNTALLQANLADAAVGTEVNIINLLKQYLKNSMGGGYGDTGLPLLGNVGANNNAVGAAAAVPGDANQYYSINNVVLHMQAYQFKTSEYYDIMNRLVDEGRFKYHYRRYVLYSDAQVADRAVNYRMVVNSECLNYVLSTFRPANYDTLGYALNTRISPSSAGHVGNKSASWEQQVEEGVPFTFNQSKYFARNGLNVSKVIWKVDETYMEGRTRQQLYFDNLRHWKNYWGETTTKPHRGLKNIYDFTNTYFTGILSFEVKSEDEERQVYALRGLNTNGKSISITCATEVEITPYTPQVGATAFGFTPIDITAQGQLCTPTYLVCTTASIQLLGKRNVDARY